MLSEREGGGMKKLKGIFGEESTQVRCSQKLWLSQFLSLFGQKGYLGDGNRQVLVISSYHHIIIYQQGDLGDGNRQVLVINCPEGTRRVSEDEDLAMIQFSVNFQTAKNSAWSLWQINGAKVFSNPYLR